MVRRLTIGILLTLALFLVPLQARTPACTMKVAGIQSMPCADCCATMKTCVLPQRNPADAATAPALNQTVLTVAMPAAPVLLRELFARPSWFASAGTQRVAHASPRLAVLCRFLI